MPRPVPLWLAFIAFLAIVALVLVAVAHWPALIAPLLVLALIGAIWQSVMRS